MTMPPRLDVFTKQFNLEVARLNAQLYTFPPMATERDIALYTKRMRQRVRIVNGIRRVIRKHWDMTHDSTLTSLDVNRSSDTDHESTPQDDTSSECSSMCNCDESESISDTSSECSSMCSCSEETVHGIKSSTRQHPVTLAWISTLRN